MKRLRTVASRLETVASRLETLTNTRASHRVLEIGMNWLPTLASCSPYVASGPLLGGASAGGLHS